MNQNRNQPFFNQIHQWMVERIVERINVLIPVGVCLLIVVMLLCMPLQWYWEHVFEGGRVYRHWPWILLFGGLFFTLAGYRHHHKTGRALFSLFLAPLGVASLVFAACFLLTAWAMDWPVWWCYVALCVLALFVIATVIGITAYSEAWRLFFNGAVVATVRRLLASGEFGRRTRERLEHPGRRAWELWILAFLVRRPILRVFVPHLREWGSPHCLRIVQGHYDDAKQPVLSCINSVVSPGVLKAYLNAGEDLVSYLMLDWPEETLSPGAKSRRISETLREMITLTLWFGRNPQSGVAISIDVQRVDQWIGQFRHHTPGPYGELLALIFGIGRNDAMAVPAPDPLEVRTTIHQVMTLFHDLSPGSTAPNGDGNDRREVCANTWLALASNRLPRQACFDGWMEMRREQGADLFVAPDSGYDPAKACARVVLPKLYDDWHRRTPPPWNEGLKGRDEYSQELAKSSFKPKAVWPQVYSDTQWTSSWVYREVWETPLVKGLASAAVLLLLAVIGVALIASNPRIGWDKWNTIDHVEDPRFGHDYTRSKPVAMAGSKDWLGIAADRVILLNKASRVPREVTKDSALDVTRGLAENEFLALLGHQGITRVVPRQWWQVGGVAPKTWLPPPKHPVWKNINSELTPSDVVANAFDDGGWLLAVRGKGIARYRFETKDGQLYRTRSWQNGDLSDIPLEQAVITEVGIWVTLKAGGIRYAERVSLKERKERAVETPPIVRLEADYQGRWAVALDKQNGFWIYTSEDKGWQGPFFGDDPENLPRLRSPLDVTLAHLQDNVAWLGTSYGLFAYDVDRRRMHCVIPQIHVNAIALLTTDDNPTSEKSILVGSAKGLFRVRGPNRFGSESFQTQQIDSSAITAMGLSPDSALCVYRARVEVNGEPPGYETRVLKRPASDMTVTTVIPYQGWKPLDAPPTIVGVERAGQLQLFATSEGAFLYHPEQHRYRDCSTSLLIWESDGRRMQEEVPVRAFSNVQQGTHHLIAIADGKPQTFQESLSKWVSLDPLWHTRPHQLTEVGEGRILGLGPEGELYWYRDINEIWIHQDFLTGQSTSLETYPLMNNTASGDLRLKTKDSWELALLHSGKVITYHSSDGNMKEEPIALEGESAQAISQLRLVSDQRLYLLNDGRILTADGKEKFGSGSLPFKPDSVTAIAPDHSTEETVLLGGPQGQVVSYHWPLAQWTTVGQGPIPGDGQQTDVVEIQDTAQGTFARLADGSIFHTWEGPWRKLDGYSRWATNSSASPIWAMGENSIARLNPRSNEPPSAWVEATYCTGTGMRSFVNSAAFAWQVDDTTVAFFSRDSRIGVYDARTDTWKEWKADFLHAPISFAVGPDCLFVLERQGVVRINKDFSSQPIASDDLTRFQNKKVNPPKPLATLDFAGHKLDWTRQPNGRLKTAWRDAKDAPPVWGAIGERLAIQCVQDIAVSRDRLLVATEAGLLVRDAKTFDLHAIYPHLKDVRFIRGDVRLLMKSQGKFYEWGGDDAVPLGAGRFNQPITSVETGPWRWQMYPSQAGILTLHVTHRTDQRVRRFSQTPTGQWEWDDDIVTWIGREPSEQDSVWLATKDGLWPFNTFRGRTKAPADQLGGESIRKVLCPEAGPWWWQDALQQWRSIGGGRPTLQMPPTEEFQIKTPAITLSYWAGQVTFRPFDGTYRPAFERGRFFFDNGAQMCSFKDELYILMPNRGLLCRNPMNLGEITGCWTLPLSLPQGARYSLSPANNGVRLEARFPGQGGLAWELDVGRDNAQWQPSRVAPDAAIKPMVELGDIAWRLRPGENIGFAPFWVEGNALPKPLDDWWSRDRFAWDEVMSVGALNGSTIVLVTPVGPIALKASDGGFKTAKIWPIRGLINCDVARNGTRPLGLAVSGAMSFSQYLLTTNPEGRPVLTLWNGGTLLYRPLLSVGYQTDALNHRYIDISQSWEPYRSPSAHRPGTLQSDLPRFPNEALLQDGQFIFDRAHGASPIGTAGGADAAFSQWLTFTNGQGIPDSTGTLCLNEVRQEKGTDRIQLVLRDVWPSPFRCHALRPSPGGGFFGLYQTPSLENGSWHVQKGDVMAGSLVWSNANLSDTGKAFRLGERVDIHVLDGKWTATPFYPWNVTTPYTVTPQGYPLFVRQPDGIALAFDVLTSLAVDRENQKLAVGARGGVFILPYTDDGKQLLALAPPNRLLTFNEQKNPDDWVIEVQRVRYDRHGRLWAKVGSAERAAQWNGSDWDIKTARWPAEYATAIDGYGKTPYERSNDAWGIGRKPLNNIVDFAFDDNFETLWLCTQNAGVFKVLPGRL